MDTNQLIASAVNNIVLPNILAWFERRRAANLPPPTLEEAQAHLHADTVDWLAENAAHQARAQQLIAEEGQQL